VVVDNRRAWSCSRW